MKIRKRWLLLPLILIVIVVVVLFALRRPIALHLVRHVAYNRLVHTWFNHLPDGLNVILCGSGGPMPNAQRAQPCTVVMAGKHIFVVDVGPGAVRNIVMSGVPIGKMEAVFLTHYHSDHIGGLGELMLQRWINGARQHPLPVYGPAPGVAQVVAGFDEAYKPDDHYRTLHHGPKIAPPSGAGGVAHPFKTPNKGQGVVVLSEDGLKVTAFLVNHGDVKPAVGYRFDYKGRSVVLSGDTIPTANLVHFAKGADLLVDEALSPKLLAIVRKQAKAAGRNNIAQIMHDVLNYHTTPVQAATEAHEAGVRALVFNHITPPLPLKPLQSMFMDGVSDHFHGIVRLGQDGMWISLPVGSDKIKIGSRL